MPIGSFTSNRNMNATTPHTTPITVCRRPSRPRPPHLGPSRASPNYPDHLPCMPCSLPRWTGTGACWFLPCPRDLPRSSGGSASTSLLSRPAQASHALRPSRLLTHHTWALSRGSALTCFPVRTLSSYQIQPTTICVSPSPNGYLRL